MFSPARCHTDTGLTQTGDDRRQRPATFGPVTCPATTGIANTQNQTICTSQPTRAVHESAAPSRRSAQLWIRVARIAAYVRLRPRMQRYSVRRLSRHTPGQLALARAWAQFWSHSSPSAAVHRWSPGSCLGSSRTVAAAGEHWSALLESVLGATPREFESRILRHADLLKHRSLAPTGQRPELHWSNLVVSVSTFERHFYRIRHSYFARSQE